MNEQEEKQKNNEKKQPLTENTVIGSRKITAADFRKFFQKTLGDDYEKYAVAWDVIKMSANHKGKTLKEIIEECFNPLGDKKLEEVLSENRFNIVSEADKAFIVAFDKVMNEMGYDSGGIINASMACYMTVKYGKTGTKTKTCPAHIEISENGIKLRLFLNKIDNHRQYIENTPLHIRNVFTGAGNECKSCSTFCKGKNNTSGKKYTIDGRMYHKCSYGTFYFNTPTVEKLSDYMDLINEFYMLKQPARSK